VGNRWDLFTLRFKQKNRRTPKGPANLGTSAARQVNFRKSDSATRAPDAMPRTAVPSRNPVRNVVRALSENRGIIRRDACHPVRYLFAICSSRGGRRKPRTCLCPTNSILRESGKAPRSGRGGRRFKSCHSDQLSLRKIHLRGMIWGTKPVSLHFGNTTGFRPIGSNTKAIRCL
jgi:hypothetical protein